MLTIRNLIEGRKMADQSTVVGATVVATPGVVYSYFHLVLEIPIEKWVSGATLVLVVLQIGFLLRHELKKRRDRHANR